MAYAKAGTTMIIALSVVGGLGAASRFVCDGFIRTKLGRTFPWATLIINVVGAGILGYVATLASHHVISTSGLLVIGTGFCGGFTTFSTACFEAVRLLEEKRYGAFGLQVLGNLVFSLLAVTIGVVLAQ